MGFYIVVTHTVKGGCKGWLMFRASMGFGIDLRWLSSCSMSIPLAVPPCRTWSVSLMQGTIDGIFDIRKSKAVSVRD